MPTTKAKRIVVDCPILKPKKSALSKNVPTLVINAEGEGSCAPLKFNNDCYMRKSISEWSEMCETPIFLSSDEIEDKDLLQQLIV